MNWFDIEKYFSGCRSILDTETWCKIVSQTIDDEKPEMFLDRIAAHCRKVDAPGFLPDLARLEWFILRIKEQEIAFPDGPPSHQRCQRFLILGRKGSKNMNLLDD